MGGATPLQAQRGGIVSAASLERLPNLLNRTALAGRSHGGSRDRNALNFGWCDLHRNDGAIFRQTIHLFNLSAVESQLRQLRQSLR